MRTPYVDRCHREVLLTRTERQLRVIGLLLASRTVLISVANQ
jgi:hypothetical protein